MDELIAFLRARLDEDHAVAVAAGSDAWHAEPFDRSGGVVFASGQRPLAEFDANPERAHAQDRAAADFHQAEHIARHDPARVLAEVEAKRRIVDRYAWLREHGDTGGTAWVLPLLALPHAGHPDYNEGWRP